VRLAEMGQVEDREQLVEWALCRGSVRRVHPPDSSGRLPSGAAGRPRGQDLADHLEDVA
jgi:hypothetical protein